jgi:3-methyl-2-oxobutanoate hydroxymethyltransferase
VSQRIKLTEGKVTVPSIKKGRKITAVTAYDFTFAEIVDEAGIDIVLVGDSLGCVIKGEGNTLGVTLDEVIYHTKSVSRGLKRSLLVADMPFLSYQVSVDQGIESCGLVIKEGRAEAVKLEGGVAVAPLIEKLSSFDIPVMGHVGLTPQSVHRMGGYKVQGKENRKKIIDDARAVESSGAFSVVLEGIPSDLAAEITSKLKIPTIGIGAGAQCDGQILVLYDLLGLSGGTPPKFVRRFADLRERAINAIKGYAEAVEKHEFPAESETYYVRKAR